MQTEIMIAGFGGQGALFAGQLLAYAAMDAGHFVTWIPSYGPEMRGGTANCTVIIADEEIGSPLVRNPGVLIAMNQPSLERYAGRVAAGGVLVINELGEGPRPVYPGLRVVSVPANAEAQRLGFAKAANLFLLGALLAVKSVLPLEALERALDAHLPAHHRARLEVNRQALRRGAALVATTSLVVEA